MTWDYRVIEDDGQFAIYEAYYNKTGEITNVTEGPVEPSGESLQELSDDVELMLQALQRPVLKMSEIKFAPMDEEVDNG